MYPLPGDGNYHLQFVHAEDMAQLIVNCIASKSSYEIDAVGPDKTTFREIIEHCSKTFSTRCRPVGGFNKKLLQYLTYPLNWYFDDILIDGNDLDLMTSGLTCSHDPPTGKISFLDWISENKETLGKEWISSINRYYK